MYIYIYTCIYIYIYSCLLADNDVKASCCASTINTRTQDVVSTKCVAVSRDEDGGTTKEKDIKSKNCSSTYIFDNALCNAKCNCC